MKLMQYVGNADSADKTGAIMLTHPDRDTVKMGGLGEFSDREVAVLVGAGYVLLAVDDGGLGDMTLDQLKKQASRDGVDTSLAKDELISALRQAFIDSPRVQSSMAIGGTPLPLASDQPAVVSASTGAGTTTGTSGSAT